MQEKGRAKMCLRQWGQHKIGWMPPPRGFPRRQDFRRIRHTVATLQLEGIPCTCLRLWWVNDLYHVSWFSFLVSNVCHMKVFISWDEGTCSFRPSGPSVPFIFDLISSHLSSSLWFPKWIKVPNVIFLRIGIKGVLKGLILEHYEPHASSIEQLPDVADSFNCWNQRCWEWISSESLIS